MSLRSSTLLALLASLGAMPAAAQDFAFPGIPWGAPADSVRARLERAGYAYRGFAADADRAFENEKYGLTAVMRADRLVAVVRWEVVDGAQARARFSVLADSLGAAHGQPTLRRADEAGWRRGFTEVQVLFVPASDASPARLALTWVGPGYYDELARRGKFGVAYPALEPGWAIVGINAGFRASLDTAAVSPRGAGVLRTRSRIDQAQAERRMHGVVDATVQTQEYDCANGRTRIVAAAEYHGGRLVHDWGQLPDPEWMPVARQPVEVHALEIVCAGRGARVPAAAVAARPAYPALQAPWVLVVEGAPGRLALDSTSLTRAAAGLELRWRHDYPNASAAPYPNTDRVDSRVRYDCAGDRFMLLSMTTYLRGRQGQSVTVPTAQRRWQPVDGDGAAQQVRPVVCSPGP